MQYAPSPSDRVRDWSIGENLDRIITVDPRGDGICRAIYDAARTIEKQPLTLAAATTIATNVTPGDAVLMLTGFLIPPSDVPETDGPIGSAVLARAIVLGLGGVPVFVGESQLRPIMDAAIRAAGLRIVDSLEQARAEPNTVVFLHFELDEPDPDARAAELAQAIAPTLAIAIERPGANPQGEYHFAGGLNVSASQAKVDSLLVKLLAQGVPAVAIGDFGNELGMGAIADVVKIETSAGGSCGCGCGGGTANEVSVTTTLACSVSDWGAYAVSALLAHLTDLPNAFVDQAVYTRIAEQACLAGAIDGTSRLAVPAIDGVPAAYNTRLVGQIADVVWMPSRSIYSASPMRSFRAERMGFVEA